MKYCSSCCHANDGGIIGNDPVCDLTSATQWRGYTCESWEQDERSFVERYPEYAYIITDQQERVMKRVMKHALENGGEAVEVEPGVWTVVAKNPKPLLMKGDYEEREPV